MIYQSLSNDAPLRQGDIFYSLPTPCFNLQRIPVVNPDEGHNDCSWSELINKEEIVATVILKKSYGIIASQDCDAARVPMITFFEIGTFEKISKESMPASDNYKKWVAFITKQSRINARLFYLPKDENIGFQDRMAINFHKIFQIPRVDLLNYLNLRRGRLNKIAYEHYRESIAQYFRRYPYDEWYPFDRKEFEAYNNDKGPVAPFDWQKDDHIS